MEEIYKTLREQIKGNFDEDNIIVILDNSISLTCKKHPISGTNNSIIIIQPYLIDTIEKTGIQSISMYEQYQMIAVYQNQIPYLDLLIQVQWIKISLNLKWYFTGMFIQQKLSKLNEDIVRHETITGKPLTKEYIRFFNEPKKQYKLTIKKLFTMEDLNLLSEELLEQIFVYLIDINWEEDQIDEILDQIFGIEEELELEDNLILLPNFPYINEYLNDYKYLIIHESPKYILLQDIPNQLYDYLEQIELFPFQGYSTTYQELEYNYNYHIRYRTQRLKIQNQIEQESQQLIKNLILSNQINNVTPTQIKIQF